MGEARVIVRGHEQQRRVGDGPVQARQRAVWRACADTARVLAEDPSLGGLVVDTRIVGRKWNREIDGLDVYVSIDLEIRTRRDFTRPGSY